MSKAASSTSSAAALAKTADSSAGKTVFSILDAMVKKANFKQLASYSMNQLSGLVSPGRVSWDLMAKAAWEQGGCSSVISVLLKYVSDGAMLKAGLTACKSMAMVAPSGGVSGEVLGSASELLSTVWKGELGDGDKVEAVSNALSYVLLLARKCSAAQLTAATSGSGNLLDLLDAIAQKLAAGWAAASNGPIATELLRLALNLVSSREGLGAVISHPTLFAALLSVPLAVLARCGGADVGAAPPATPALAREQFSTLRSVLDPALRLLDRVSRTEEGAVRLKAFDAMGLSLPLVDWWLHAWGGGGLTGADSASGASASALKSRVSLTLLRGSGGGGGNSTSSSSASATVGASGKLIQDSALRREQASRMLARLCDIPDRLATIARSSALLVSLVSLLNDSCVKVAGGSGGADAFSLIAPLLVVIVRVVERGSAGASSPGIQVALQVGALPALLTALTVATSAASSLPTDTCAAAAMRALHVILSIAGSWTVTAGGIMLGGESIEEAAAASATSSTVLAYALTVFRGCAAAPPDAVGEAAFSKRLHFSPASPAISGAVADAKAVTGGTAISKPESLLPSLSVTLPLLLRILAAHLSASADIVPNASALQPFEYGQLVARLSCTFYAQALVRELVFSATGGEGGGGTASSSSSSSSSASASDAPSQATLRKALPSIVATLSSAACLHSALQDTLALNTFTSNVASACSSVDATAATFAPAWLPTGTATLAVQSCCALASSSPDVAELLRVGALQAVYTILTSRDAADDAADAVTGRPVGTTSSAAVSKRRGAFFTGPTYKRDAKVLAAALASASRIGNGWLALFTTDQPRWTLRLAAELHGSASKGDVSANITRPETLGADTLYFMSTIMTYLVAHAQSAQDAKVMPPETVVAIGPLAALADADMGYQPSRTTDARGALETIRQAVNAGLQAALVTYSTYNRNPAVYANFKDLVEASNVGAEEVISAIDVLRGCATALRKTVLSAPTRSSANAGNAAVASLFKPGDARLEMGAMLSLDKSDADSESSRSSSEAGVRAKMDPKAKDYFGSIYEIASIARQKLLLLEAISLSPFQAWGLCAINGALPILTIIQSLSVAVSVHNDIDVSRANKLAGGAGPISAPKMLERVDAALKHATTVMAHLSRVAFEMRTAGSYVVPFETSDSIRLPATLDGHLIPLSVFGPEAPGIISAAVNSCMSSGQRVPLFASAAIEVQRWQAAIANVPRAKADTLLDPGWGSNHIAQLIEGEFVEATVALLRFTSAQLQKALDKAASPDSPGSSSSSGSDNGEDVMLQHFDNMKSLFGNLIELASTKSGAIAIATRGASRQALRALPILLSALEEGDKSAPAYRPLVSLLRVLSACLNSGGAEVEEDKSGGGFSAGALMHKQGLVERMVQVIFSPVGITSGVPTPTSGDFGAYGEACQLAVSIVSAVSVKRDVLNAISTLYEVCESSTKSLKAYTTAAAAEIAVWNASVSGSAPPSLGTGFKRAILTLDPAEGGGGGGSAAAGGSNSSSSSGGGGGGATTAGTAEDGENGASSVLMASLQLLGVLMVTDAGRRSGLENLVNALEVFSSIVKLSSSYLNTAARVVEAVTSAVGAASTPSAEDKPAPSLPKAFVDAAAASLAPPSKAERDAAWCLNVALTAARSVIGAALDACVGEAASGGQFGLSPGEALSFMILGERSLDKCIDKVIETFLGAVEMGNSGAMPRMSALASGATIASALPQRAKGINPVPFPTGVGVINDSMSGLAIIASAANAAKKIPSSSSSRGIDIVLAAMAAAEEIMHVAAGGAGTSSGEGGEEADSSHLAVNALDISCHALSVLSGVADAGADVLPIFIVAGVTPAINDVLGYVMDAATSVCARLAASSAHAVGETAADAAFADEAIANLTTQGCASACSVLAHLAFESASECKEMVGHGIVTFMRSALTLCGDDTINASIPPRPSLLNATARLSRALATVGGIVSAAPTLISEDVEEDAAQVLSMREIVVKAFTSALAAKAYIDSLPCFHASLLLVLTYAQAAEGIVPAGVALRTLKELQAEAGRYVPSIRRGISNASASAPLIADGKAVIALLQPPRAATAVSSTEAEGASSVSSSAVVAEDAEGGGEGGTAEGGNEAVAEGEEARDEVLEAVANAYARLMVLHEYYVGIDDRIPMEQSDAAAAELAALAGIDECLDHLRTLALIIPPFFPIAEFDETKPMEAALPASTWTAATVWQVFCTARDYITSVLGILADNRSTPRNPKVITLLFDIVSACMPITSRMSIFAENSRQAVVAAYWAGTSPEWELPAEQDVPMSEAVASIGISMQSHLYSADRTLRADQEVVATTASRPAAYVPNAMHVDQVCKSFKSLVAAAGHEAVAALVKAGQLTDLLRLSVSIRMIKERAADARAKGDKSLNRTIVAEAERCLQNMSSVVRFIASKGQSEVQAYCSNADGASDDSLRDVSSILPAAAIAGLLRASAVMSVAASDAGGAEEDEDDEEEDDEEEEESKSNSSSASASASAEGGKKRKSLADRERMAAAAVKARAADNVLESQVRAIVDGKEGIKAIFGLLEEVGSSTLASASLSGDLSTPFEVRVQLKLFHTTLTVLSEKLTAAKKSESVPANMSVLRGLYAGVINALQVVMGDSFTSATHSAALQNLYHDPALDEFTAGDASGGGAVKKAESLKNSWVSAPDAAKLENVSEADVVVEEI